MRRRILLLLMLLGNAGIITAVSSLILTFISPNDSGSLNLKLFMLISGIVILWMAAAEQKKEDKATQEEKEKTAKKAKKNE